MTELARCPLCGGADIYMEPDERGSGGQWVYPVHMGCKPCGLDLLCASADNPAEAIAAWNRRALEPPPTTDFWSVAAVAHRIADGFTDGNEQYDEASGDQQRRYIEAARSVLEPPPVVVGREEIAAIISDTGPSYSIVLASLNDGQADYQCVFNGEPALSFDSHGVALEYVADRRDLAKVDAIISLLVGGGEGKQGDSSSVAKRELTPKRSSTETEGH